MPFDYTWIKIIAELLSPIIFIFAVRSYYPNLFPKLWFILRAKYIKIPFRKSPMVQKIVNKELKDSEKQRYESFEAFLQDCPKYQIQTGMLSTMIRNIYRSAGIRFQQYVFIDRSASQDKTAWLRREGEFVLHNKGTYANPSKSEKDIIYFDIRDSRPLIDLSNDDDWKNPDAFADVVTSITNTNDMNKFRGQTGTNQGTYVLIACILIIILVAVDIYTGDTSSKNAMDALTNIANHTSRIP